MKAMIIVESKAKVQSIGKIVGEDYTLAYCLGHVYDLPEKDLGIDIKNNFKPQYIPVRGKGKLISSLKTSGKEFGTVILATDPDREGESIAWHLSKLFAGKTIRRMRFNEITEKGILEGLNSLSDIDMRLVNAQQARRVLDRLVGYKISPLLWKFLKGGLSAGRVQSVALRLICDREREIANFTPEEWWSLTGEFLKTAGPPSFKAAFYGKKGEEIPVKTAEQAERLAAELKDLAYKVDSVDTREEQRRPLPPYITSSLQQDAARRLNFSTSKTMTIAQQLYEGVDLGAEGVVGLITYMRTDSVRVSTYAQDQAMEYITATFGKEYAPAKPNVFKTKSGVQDAHEAIRPTYVDKEPKNLKSHLNRDQIRLYEIIWNRFLASQMKPARVAVTRADIKGGEYIFRATGTVLLFDGCQRIYNTQKEVPEVENDKNDKAEKEEQKLPPLAKGESLDMKDLLPRQHFTKPPARFSEASLVRVLEEKGIGRPSTFVPTIETIKKRGYVEMDKRVFMPTKWGFIVTDLLSKNFTDIVDYEFTARMENDLDSVEQGEKEWEKVVGAFYEKFLEDLNKASTNMKYEEKVDDICEKCGASMVLKPGRYGLFLSCSKYPACNFTKQFDATETAGKPPKPKTPPLPSGKKCEKCGKEMLIREGRYGKFLACSGYPKCKNLKPYIGDFDCPREGCDGKVVKKVTKNRKTIYGCSKYPDCDFVSWYPPLEEKCPSCGTFLLRSGFKGKIVKKCANDKCAKVFEDTAADEKQPAAE